MSGARRSPSKDAGFSMIEVMVSAAIVAIAVLGLASQLTMQKNAKGSLDTANLGRRIMIKLIDSVIAQPYRFPYFENVGKGIVYVGCFDANGGPVPSDPAAPVASLKDFQGVWSMDPTNAAQLSKAQTAGNLVCTQANVGGYEVHVAPSPQPADGQGAMISVVAIALGVTASQIQQSSSPVFSVTVRLGGLPSIAAAPGPWAAANVTGRWCAPSGGCQDGVAGGAAASAAGCLMTTCYGQTATPDYCYCF